MVTTNEFTSGINQDVLPKFQPKGTYRYALNAVQETVDGDQVAISNERGTLQVYIKSNWGYDNIIIGHCTTDNDDIVLFLKGNASHTFTLDTIALVNPKTATWELLMSAECLNFSLEHQINCIFKIRNGCERIIYFTDNYNHYRVLNVTDALAQGGYDLDYCPKIEYSRDYSHPTYSVDSTLVRDYGGQLDYGSYGFAIRMLDDEENPTTEWIFNSNYIPVFYGSSTIAINQHGVSNESDSVYYKPKSSKSIVITWGDLDSSFKYYQVAVIKRTSDDGTISGVDILFPREFGLGTNANQDVFIYTGADSDVKSQTSIDEILSSYQRIDKVVAHSFQDNRLYVAGVTNQSLDYSEYQRKASLITTKYQAIVEDRSNATNPSYYFQTATGNGYGFLPDEVYSLGIVYVHNDGSESPVFHIPGRATVSNAAGALGTNPYLANDAAWDTLDVPTSNANNIFNSTQPRWKVYNTATVDAGGTSTASTGLMGYYQITNVYPEIAGCDGDSFWGEDAYGNDLEGTPIRHHRMPSEELFNLRTTGDTTVTSGPFRVGIQFQGVVYPNADVVGHYFVYGDRTNDKTILDKGLINMVRFDGSNTYEVKDLNDMGTGTYSTSLGVYSFISPKTLLGISPPEGTYLKVTKFLKERTSGASSVNAATNVDNDIYGYTGGSAVSTTSNIWDWFIYGRPITLNYSLSSLKYIPRVNSDLQDNEREQTASYFIIPASSNRVLNNTHSANMVILRLANGTIAETQLVLGSIQNRALYGSLVSRTEVFTNLYSIKYKRATPFIFNGNNSGYWFNGDIFQQQVVLVNDTFPNGGTKTVNITLNAWFTESEINFAAKYRTDAEYGKYKFFQYSDGYPHSLLKRYVVREKIYEIEGDSGTTRIYPEHYSYTPNLQHKNHDKYYYPIPFNFQMCSTCRESFPNRIFYSDIDLLETRADGNRLISPNNYRDISAAEGPITDMFLNRDNLHVLTTNCPYFVPTRPQEIKTDAGTAYLGTGSLLSVPPRRMHATDYAYGGTSHFKTRAVTDYGTVYIDDISGRPFLIGEQLTDLSTKGLRNFFQENGKILLREQFKSLTESEYPFTSTSSNKGVGYIVTYDPRHKRVIIHKKDYVIRKDRIKDFSYNTSPTTAGKLFFNNNEWYYNITTSTPVITGFNNPNYFESKSWSLSYSFLTNSWSSFHSYLPYYLLNGYDTFYSNNLYKHNSGEYQTYYDDKKDFVLDVIIPQDPQTTKTTSSVYYSSKSEIYDDINKSYKDVDTTFDAAIAYNSNQSSGKIDIVPSTPYSSNSSSQLLVDRVDKKYRINGFHDYTQSNQEPIWRMDWDALQADYPIDKVPNNLNIDPNQSLFNTRRFKDYYFGLRLFFNPNTNAKISTDVVNTINLNNFR